MLVPVLVASVVVPLAALTPERLKSSGALPAFIAGQFEQPLAFQPAPGGATYVFDRRGHSVYRVDPARTAATRIVSIGGEEGRLLRPSAFAAAPDGSFAVADAPREKERIQVFNADGLRIGGFELPSRALPRVTFDSLVLNGIGSMRFTGSRILVSQPENGSLVTEYDIYGRPQRTFGNLRATGHEADRELHLALNSGIPLALPDGGFVFVFQTGTPQFQRYDAKGQLLFTRHIEGLEIDEHVRSLPAVWPRRQIGSLELPLVTPTIRAAAIDPRGHLWISFVVPYLYEYDAQGDKRRVVQLHAAGVIAPTSLAFGPTGRLMVTPGLFEFDVLPAR
ncbi:MAG TPA: hypothetical protein VIL35_15480 [Vicinamibacterales bacterium]